MAGPAVLYDEGIHADRPANGAGCVLYTCTTHGLVYRDDGSAWTTWLTLPGAGSTAAEDITITDAGAYFTGTDVEAALQELGAAGGGSPWALVLDEDGSDFTPFTATSGTWASTGTIIQQTSTTGSVTRRARVNAKFAIGGPFIYQADIRLPSAGQIAGTNVAGLTAQNDGASDPGDGIAVLLSEGNGAAFEVDGTAALRTITATIALDTWYTLRLICGSRAVSAVLDGTVLGTTMINTAKTNADFVGLRTFNAIADYRNIKLWTPTAPA